MAAFVVCYPGVTPTQTTDVPDDSCPPGSCWAASAGNAPRANVLACGKTAAQTSGVPSQTGSNRSIRAWLSP